MFLILGFILVTPLLFAWLVYLFKFKHMIDTTRDIPSPPSLPIIGHAHHLIGLEPHEYLQKFSEFVIEYGYTLKVWLGPDLIILTSNMKFIETVMNSMDFNHKSNQYEVLRPWLREGLLVSRGQKWHKRRKIITPAFHFKILEQFIEIFERESRTLLKNLDNEYRIQNQNGFALYDWINLCTLDTICETAMGVSANAQINTDSEYVRAVKTISTVLHKRMLNALYRLNFTYKLTKLARDEKKALKALHGFTEKIIKERREELIRSQDKNRNKTNNEEDIGAKKKMAFLDMLLQSEIDGKPLSDLDIREEVDTFMFEGHDTTSSAVTFFFFNIGTHPDCQQKCFEEIISIVGKDLSAPITYEDLNNMHYVDLCIKETLRLFPPVPLLGREVNQDCVIDDYKIPAGASIVISPLILGRRELLFPQADKFKPERFDVVTNAEKMNPFAFIPFSAGVRNCIGQKFAMLEIKTIVANVLRHYEIEFVDNSEEKFLVAELILRTKNPLMFKIKRRCN